MVVFDAELYDTNSNFNTANGRYTAPVSGFYWFNMCVTYSINSNANTAFGQSIRVNGSTGYGGSNTVNMYAGAYGPSSPSGKMLSLSANDYVEVTTISGGQALITGAGNTFFEGFLISRT